MKMYMTEKIDAGQLDLMWQFLKFGNSKLNTADIKAIENNLEIIREMMLRKKGDYEPLKWKDGNVYSYGDLMTLTNNVVICCMQIYLSGGFDILKEYIKNNGKRIEE